MSGSGEYAHHFDCGDVSQTYTCVKTCQVVHLNMCYLVIIGQLHLHKSVKNKSQLLLIFCLWPRTELLYLLVFAFYFKIKYAWVSMIIPTL